jgi:hypothetical protein
MPPQLITAKVPRLHSSFFKKYRIKCFGPSPGKTAAELIESRSNPDKQNMGLAAWRGSIVRK